MIENDRLLTDEEIVQIYKDAKVPYFARINMAALPALQAIILAQRELTAAAKDREWAEKLSKAYSEWEAATM